MRFMTIVKSRETGARPSPALIEKIMKLGEEASKKGVMVEMGGLGPTALGARARLANGKITITDGPFTEAKEVLGGFAIYDVPSKKDGSPAKRLSKKWRSLPKPLKLPKLRRAKSKLNCPTSLPFPSQDEK